MIQAQIPKIKRPITWRKRKTPFANGSTEAHRIRWAKFPRNISENGVDFRLVLIH